MNKNSTETTVIDFDGEKIQPFQSRTFEKALGLLEDKLHIKAGLRGNRLILKGDRKVLKTAEKIVRDLGHLNLENSGLSMEDVKNVISAATEDETLSVGEMIGNNITVSSKRRVIVPKTATQKQYVEAIQTNDMVIGIGPAGTGKTYLAMAMAINALIKKQVSRIVLARPAIEAGEKLGFLPGDMIEKVNPYLRPLYDALYDMMEAEKAMMLIEKGVIEIAPLAFMRGRTLNDAFIILDEAQNTTSEQMKMYLTRLGFNSKTVITGDVTQIDLPQGKASGLVEIIRVLEGIRGIRFVFFKEKDVVRHKLVQEIIRAYERYEKRDIEG